MGRLELIFRTSLCKLLGKMNYNDDGFSPHSKLFLMERNEIMTPAPKSQEPLTAERPVPTSRRRRIPKAGLGFSILRLFGLALQGIGVLIAIASCIGFFILLVRIAPELTEVMQHLESQMAGFTFIIMLVWLCAPLILVLLGAISFGLGFVFYRVSTRPVPDSPAQFVEEKGVSGVPHTE
jgi:hypothetical protein